jgi:bifunctional non-homologous end joining protein LigD
METMALPEHVRPMLATAGTLPRSEDAWSFELKWDGVRAISYWDGSTLRLESRNLRDITVSYPELQALGPALPEPIVLDGEIVALDERGVPSFQRLQERMHVADARMAVRKAGEVPVAYFLFDVLHRGDRSLMPLPQAERRALLDELGLSGPSWATPPAYPGEGTTMMAVAEQRGLEGVVAKRLDCPYVPGQRSKAWIKVKVTARDEFVVGGWQPGEGRREGEIGSLLLGLPADDGRLTFVGAVGTGFTEKELRRLRDRFAPIRRETSPFTEPLPPQYRRAQFVDPEAVVDVEYRERTTGGILRHPSYKGERIDKGVQDVNTDRAVDEERA